MSYTNSEDFDILLVLGHFQYSNINLEEYFRDWNAKNSVRKSGQIQTGQNKNKETERPARNNRATEVLAALQTNPYDFTRRSMLTLELAT